MQEQSTPLTPPPPMDTNVDTSIVETNTSIWCNIPYYSEWSRSRERIQLINNAKTEIDVLQEEQRKKSQEFETYKHLIGVANHDQNETLFNQYCDLAFIIEQNILEKGDLLTYFSTQLTSLEQANSDIKYQKLAARFKNKLPQVHHRMMDDIQDANNQYGNYHAQRQQLKANPLPQRHAQVQQQSKALLSFRERMKSNVSTNTRTLGAPIEINTEPIINSNNLANFTTTNNNNSNKQASSISLQAPIITNVGKK